MKNVVYAINIDAQTYEDKGNKILDFVYLHGTIEDRNGYDLVAVNKEDFKVDLDTITDITVVFEDGTEIIARLYYWRVPSLFKLTGQTTKKVGTPYIIRQESHHGLICDINDKVANEFAIQKFNERASVL